MIGAHMPLPRKLGDECRATLMLGNTCNSRAAVLIHGNARRQIANQKRATRQIGHLGS